MKASKGVSTPVQVLIFVLLCYVVYLLLLRPSSVQINSGERRWVVHNGFCILPYVHAGWNATIRLLDDSSDTDDLILTEIPKDDPQDFEDDLTLLTHSSASALNEIYLSDLMANWRGPISLAVSLQGQFNEEYVKQKISRALNLLSNIDDGARLAVHVIVNRVGNQNCEQSMAENQKKLHRGVFFASYPINTVRNVARLFSSSRYISFADADYIFSAGFYEKMLAILREKVMLGSKIALLYRIFEVDEIESRKKEHQLKKTDLKTLIDKEKARVFHGKTWSIGHAMPKLPQWLEEPESDHPGIFNLTISVKNRTVWEFQFSTMRNVPLFDENFPYRADNNLELRWEVCRAGYELLPVQDLFVYHTISRDKHDKDDAGKKNSIRKKNSANWTKAKKDFKKRIQTLYPDTKDRCPV